MAKVTRTPSIRIHDNWNCCLGAIPMNFTSPTIHRKGNWADGELKQVPELVQRPYIWEHPSVGKI